jgi:hypothetical protein
MAEQTSFFEHLIRAFGQNIQVAFRDYWKYNEKLASMNARKEFLIKCRQYEVIPAHITQRFKCVYTLFEERSPVSSRMAASTRRFQRNILSMEIKQTIYKITEISKIMDDCKEIMQTTPNNTHENFIGIQKGKYKEMFKEHRRICNTKFEKLMVEQLKLPGFQEDWVVNLTDVG